MVRVHVRPILAEIISVTVMKNQIKIKLDTSTIFHFSELEPLIQSSGLEYDLSAIQKAYLFAAEKHFGQTRMDGTPYVSHLLTVSKYLVELGMDTISVIAGLLHDTVEDCGVLLDELELEFGIEIAYIVDGLTNVHNLEDRTKYDDLENFQKMILKSVDDIRIIIIKLCDKLHNLSNMSTYSEEKKIKSAENVKALWEPISEYLGLFLIKREYQDICFNILDKENYLKVQGEYDMYVEKHLTDAKNLQTDIVELLNEYKLEGFKVDFRVKSIGSFYDKVARKAGDKQVQNQFELVPDIFAYRILVHNVEMCYEVLSLISAKFKLKVEEYDDYIAKPKKSGYKSLHTVVLPKEDLQVEIQIKTYEMHDYNEYGPASHIAYKNGGKDYSWVRSLQDYTVIQKTETDSSSYKENVFKGKVFVFTPEYNVKVLSEGSVPIDFAYEVHTEVGDSYAGAKVNGKIVSADYTLKTGDIVEILTSKNRLAPSLDILKHARMSETRSRIRRARNRVNSLNHENL